MIAQNDFFIEENIIKNIPESNYNIISHIIEDIGAIARTTFRSIYIIDYYKQNFLYVSDNPLFLCGMLPEEVKDLGYGFYLNHMPADDLKFLLKVNKVGFEFINSVAKKEKRNYTLSCDFNILHKYSQKTQLINHQITPLRLTEDGQVWLALCVSSIASGQEAGNILMSNTNDRKYLTYNIQAEKWNEKLIPILKEIEKEILKLSAMGFSMKEIAVNINRSFDTVKLYRKTIFNKFDVNNISEAISYAKIRRLI